MPRALTNKQVLVLELLRAEGPLSAKGVAAKITEQTVCGECDGSGKGQHRHYGCRACYGRGKAYFGYSTAYQALQRLCREGLVTRTCKRDQFGDELLMHIYSAAAAPDLKDPLEKLWALPTRGDLA